MRKLFVISSCSMSLLFVGVASAQGNNTLTLTSEKMAMPSVVESAPTPSLAHHRHRVAHQQHHHGHHHHTHHHSRYHSHHAHHRRHQDGQKTLSHTVPSTLPPLLLRAPTQSSSVHIAQIASTSSSSSTYSHSTRGAHLALISMSARSTNLMMAPVTKPVVNKKSTADLDEAKAHYFHPFLTASAGMVSTFIGKTLIFPINNTTYYYYPSNRYKTLGILGATIGDELRFAHNINWQVGVSYYGEGSTRVSGQLNQGVDAPSTSYYRYHYTVSTQQVFLENKLSITMAKYYYPYVSFGVGESFNKAYQYNTTVSPYDTYTPSFDGKTLVNFAWTLGAGIDAELTDHVRFGVGYRFDYLGPVSLERAQLITQAQTVNVSYRLKQPIWRMNAVLAQLTYIM